MAVLGVTWEYEQVTWDYSLYYCSTQPKTKPSLLLLNSVPVPVPVPLLSQVRQENQIKSCQTKLDTILHFIIVQFSPDQFPFYYSLTQSKPSLTLQLSNLAKTKSHFIIVQISLRSILGVFWGAFWGVFLGSFFGPFLGVFLGAFLWHFLWHCWGRFEGVWGCFWTVLGVI